MKGKQKRKQFIEANHGKFRKFLYADDVRKAEIFH